MTEAIPSITDLDAAEAANAPLQATFRSSKLANDAAFQAYSDSQKAYHDAAKAYSAGLKLVESIATNLDPRDPDVPVTVTVP